MKVTSRIACILNTYDTASLRGLAEHYNRWFGTDYTSSQLNPAVSRDICAGKLARYLQPREGKPPHFIYFVPSHLKG